MAFARGDGDLPLPKPVGNAILASKRPGIWRMSDLHKARIAAKCRQLCSRLRELIFGHVPDQTVMLGLRCAVARYGARPRQRRE
jgi:hypothetical protein